MGIGAKALATLTLFTAPPSMVHAQAAGQWTDWGGGYRRGPDSASVTVATSGAGTARPAAIVIPATPATLSMTDWGGGYRRGPDSASTTIATSGAGTPKPNN